MLSLRGLAVIPRLAKKGIFLPTENRQNME
jgi:hypothetical protein